MDKPKRRPRPQVVQLTEKAAEHLKGIMTRADEDYVGLRLGLKNAGCAGMAYTMDYATEQGPMDEVVEDKGIKIFIDPKDLLFLIGTEMDWEETKLRSGFVFKNPNETDACGCGESVTIQPLQSLDAEEAETISPN